jgi:hypothetical protein
VSRDGNGWKTRWGVQNHTRHPLGLQHSSPASPPITGLTIPIPATRTGNEYPSGDPHPPNCLLALRHTLILCLPPLPTPTASSMFLNPAIIPQSCRHFQLLQPSRCSPIPSSLLFPNPTALMFPTPTLLQFPNLAAAHTVPHPTAARLLRHLAAPGRGAGARCIVRLLPRIGLTVVLLDECKQDDSVVWTSLGPLPRWVPGPTTRWAPGTTPLVPHCT